jgi:hypothetical protein
MKTETKNGVVVFLDALGVSGYNLDKCREFVEKRDKIVERLIFVSAKWGIQFEKDLEKILLKPNIAIIQDSLILWWPEQKENSLPFFFGASQIAAAIINLAIEEGIFLRGAISVGEYLYEESPGNVTIIGPAVADAYKYHNIAVWVGVIQTPAFRSEYLALLKSVAEREGKTIDEVIEYHRFLYVPINIPLHSDEKGNETLSKEKFFAVSWPQLTYQIQTNGGDRIIEILTDETHRQGNNKYKSYFENSLKFAEWYGDNKYIPPPE